MAEEVTKLLIDRLTIRDGRPDAETVRNFDGVLVEAQPVPAALQAHLAHIPV